MLCNRKQVKQFGKMKTELQTRSDDPINSSLETFGDMWSLLIVRDIVYFGKKTYGEYLDSDEGIATNILASRLAQLARTGILMKQPDATDRRIARKLEIHTTSSLSLPRN
jgi:DNA-binding HxlR family transcriptional regulator